MADGGESWSPGRVLLPTIRRLESLYGMAVPRVVAAAVLRAYSEKRVPLSVQDASEWYGLGGRYWTLVWMVCGWVRAGDKFIGDKSLAWAEPLAQGSSREFWREMGNLAQLSDTWQLAQGIDVEPPPVDVAALTNRSRDWRHFFELHPIWNQPAAARSVALVAFLKEAWKQLQEWYRKRYPGRPPLPPALPSADGVLIVAALVGLAILGGAGRRTNRNRRRR